MRKMAKQLVAIGTLAGLGLLGLACAGPDGDPEVEEAEASQYVGALAEGHFDSDYPTAALGRPRELIDVSKLGDGAVAAVLGHGEAFTPQGTLGRRASFRSETYDLDSEAAAGQLFFRVREDRYGVPAGRAVDGAALQRSALETVAALGIPSSSVGAVLQRRLGKQGSDDPAPTVTDHVTFLFRRLNGIPVLHSKATVVHDVAGRLTHVKLDWRPVADEGKRCNVWSPTIGKDRARTRVKAALAARGLAARDAQMRLVYDTGEDAGDGSVCVRIGVLLRVAGRKLGDGATGTELDEKDIVFVVPLS